MVSTPNGKVSLMSRAMRQEAIIPFPHLPFDISREIFEQAVLHNKADRYSLALVSRLVQKWTDPQVFRIVTISSYPHAERFRNMLEVTQKSGRFIQALSFVQTLALEISSFKMSWEMIVLNFPRLVVLYWDGSDGGDFVEGNVDPATCNPPSIPTLRRLGGGYGYKTLYGLWECVQGLTHLDLTMVASDTWSTLGNRGLPLLSNLTHLLVCLEVLQKMDASERDIQVLLPLFPPSLLLCLVRGEDFHLWSTEEINSFSNLMYTLDDRLIVCMGTDSPMQNQWILKMKWGDEFTDWSGQRDERDTFWARGLSMVAERRTAISTSD